MEHSKGFYIGQEDQLEFIDNALNGFEDLQFDDESTVDDSLFILAAEELFSPEDIFKTFMVLHDYDETPDPWRINAIGCHCNYYCGLGTCEKGGCTSSSSGCGIFWLSSCRGLCDNLPT